jgi:hypothetical protein
VRGVLNEQFALETAVVKAALQWHEARNHLGENYDLSSREAALMDAIGQLYRFLNPSADLSGPGSTPGGLFA